MIALQDALDQEETYKEYHPFNSAMKLLPVTKSIIACEFINH